MRASQSLDDTSKGTKKKAKQGKKRSKAAQAAAQKAAAATAAAKAAAQAAAQAAQAAALGRYRLVNAWFYPRGDWYTFYWDGSSADKVARRATYPTLEHDNYDPASSQSASGATSARGAAVRPLLRRLSSDQDSCGSGSTTSEANDIFDTLDDHLGF